MSPSAWPRCQAIGLVAGLGYIKSGWFNYVLVGISMAGGSALAMWIGERISEKGVGNGISMLIMAGILCNLFNGIVSGFTNASVGGTGSGWMNLLVIAVMFVIMVVVVTFVDMGERRIPLQIAKQVKGRRVYGGQNTHMSLKVCSVGVLPLIFAYSFLAFPGTIIQLVGGTNSGAYIWWNTYMNTGSVWYMIISALLIMAFTFFYSSISFDAKRQAEQLTMQGAVIPGQRGKNIRGFLQTTVNRLNLFSALFLAILAAVPTILTTQLNTGGALRGFVHPDRCERVPGDHPRHPRRDEHPRHRQQPGYRWIHVRRPVPPCTGAIAPGAWLDAGSLRTGRGETHDIREDAIA